MGISSLTPRWYSVRPGIPVLSASLLLGSEPRGSFGFVLPWRFAESSFIHEVLPYWPGFLTFMCFACHSPKPSWLHWSLALRLLSCCRCCDSFWRHPQSGLKRSSFFCLLIVARLTHAGVAAVENPLCAVTLPSRFLQPPSAFAVSDRVLLNARRKQGPVL